MLNINDADIKVVCHATIKRADFTQKLKTELGMPNPLTYLLPLLGYVFTMLKDSLSK